MKLMQVSLCALALAIALPLAAQDKPPQMTAEQQAMMQAWEKAAAPGEPHKQLATMQGKWNVKQTMWMDPGSEPMVQTGSATNKIELGGRRFVSPAKAADHPNPDLKAGPRSAILAGLCSAFFDRHVAVRGESGDEASCRRLATMLGNRSNPVAAGSPSQLQVRTDRSPVDSCGGISRMS